MKELTARQKEVLSFISGYVNANWYSPSVRDVAERFCITAKAAHDHITALKRKGFLKQEDKRPRTLGLVREKAEDKSGLKIPILGNVAAGQPLLAEENFDGSIIMHHSMLKKNKKYFALNVKGDSMSGAGIMDGDMAIIEKQSAANNGEIVVAVVNDAITLKRFYKESARIKLKSENPAYKPIYCRDVRVVGRLVHVIRSYT